MALQAVWRLYRQFPAYYAGSNNGTDTDITFVGGGNLGKAASFNGSTSKIVIGNVFNLGTATNLLLSGWVKMNAANLLCELVTKNGYDIFGWRLLKFNSDNKYYFQEESFRNEFLIYRYGLASYSCAKRNHRLDRLFKALYRWCACSGKFKRHL